MRLTRRMGPDYRACARGRLLRLFVWSSCLVAVLTLRPFAAAQDARPGFGEDPPRIKTSAPIFFDAVETVRFTPSGSVSDLGLRTASAGSCVLQSTYTDADFDPPGNFSIVLGVAETEIFAASYTIAPEFFPIEIQTVEMVFAQTGVEDTVTELELWIMKGTPDQSQIVHIVSNIFLDFTTSLADAINVMIDLSANPVLVENNGTDTFSVGFRIVEHNNQTENPCNFNPPANSNAFPTVDVSGVQNEADNWLFSINCGPLGCPAFWNSFEFLGLCQPAGDWVLRTTWAPTVCPVAGACCLPGGGCEDLFESECQTQEGTFLGEETTCASSTCPEACCFMGGGCLDLLVEDCLVLAGTPQGPLTDCSDDDGDGAADICKLPTGACCLANGGCQDDVNSVACEAGDGAYQGDGTLCSAVDCLGACCFGADGLSCFELTASDCDQLPNPTWQGPQLSCDDFPCGETGACCQSNGVCDGDQTAVQCENAGGIFQGNGIMCASPEVQCDPFGACCIDNGGCDITCNEQETAENCTALGGNYQGDGNNCSTCETCEACCVPCTQACLNLLPSVCLDFENEPQGEGSNCANTACDAPLGACCGPEPDICHDLFEFDCNTVGGIWQGCEILCSDPQVDCATIGCEFNSDCDDGNVCNGAETCVANVCQDGTPLDCDDLNACTLDSCDALTGCAHEAVDCTAAGDQCNTASCNPAGADGNCDILTQEPDGTPCSDGAACMENDQCTAGSCGGTAVNCSGVGDQCNTASCDPNGAEGNCDTLTPVTDGTPCSDGDACTQNDECTAGSCGGTAVDCSAAGDQCNTASCDPNGAEGNCDTLTPKPDDTPCDDQNACTDNDICTAGVCGGTAVDCTEFGDQCNIASCDSAGADGNCDILTQEPDGTPCSDGDACTVNDQCTAGICGGTAVDCTAASDQCNTASCDPAGADGNCDILTQEPDGTPCDDQDACTESDICTAGVCGGAAVDCTGAGDQCNTASCDPAGAEGNCDTLTPEPDGTLCDDQDACTESDNCTSGVCGGTAVDCTGFGDQCNIASCDPAGADGNCDVLTPEPDGTPCDDQDACTESDICTSGVCSGAAVDCTGAGDQCNTASCDPAGAEGNCDILTPKPDGTLCDDQDACTQNDQCTAGLCGGAPITPCCGNGITEEGEQCDPPDGTTCDENCQFLPTGACCKITGSCQEAISENACNAAGGTYQGDGSICEPDLCPPCIPNPGAAENDCCADAIPISTGLTNFNTTNSNTDGPSHQGICQFDGQTYNDIWYQYMADCTVDTIVTTCDDLGAGADYDTDLVVYDSCDCDNLPLLGCNDDDPDNPCGGIDSFQSTVTVPMVAGSCYMIRVGGWQDKDQGIGTLLIEPQCGACCQGDVCVDNQGSQECADAGGVFQGAGSACVGGGGDIDCTITGACCTMGGGCAQMTFQGCAEQSGDYQGDGMACDPDPCGCGDCPTDVNDDGETGPFDLAFLLGNWGPFGPDAECLDANFDDIIGPFDLAFLLGNWGLCQ